MKQPVNIKSLVASYADVLNRRATAGAKPSNIVNFPAPPVQDDTRTGRAVSPHALGEAS